MKSLSLGYRPHGGKRKQLALRDLPYTELAYEIDLDFDQFFEDERLVHSEWRSQLDRDTQEAFR